MSKIRICLKTYAYDFSQTGGGWAGQIIGCTFGGETEFRYCGRTIAPDVAITWNDTLAAHYYAHWPGLYDDVYMDLTFVQVFENYGLDAPTHRFAEAFAYAGYDLWHANQAARTNCRDNVRSACHRLLTFKQSSK